MAPPQGSESGHPAPRAAVPLHPALARDLEEVGAFASAEPPSAEAWRALLVRVSQVYTALDEARAALESRARAGREEAFQVTGERVSGERVSGERASSVLDRTVLDSIRGLGRPGDPDPVVELCTMFVSDMGARFANLTAAAAAGDAAAVVRQAHAIKGAAGNFGANRLYTAAGRLQALAAAARANADVVAATADLGVELDRVRAVVERDILGR